MSFEPEEPQSFLVAVYLRLTGTGSAAQCLFIAQPLTIPRPGLTLDSEGGECIENIENIENIEMPATVFAGTCPEQRPGTRAPAQCLQQECSIAGDSSPAALNLGQYTAVVNCIE